MDIAAWYAVPLGGSIALSIMFCITLPLADWLRVYGPFYFRKHVLYPLLPLIRGRQETTRFEFLIFLLFLGVNILSMTLHVASKDLFMRRSGTVCTINFIPLALGAQMNLLLNGCGITLNTYAKAHRWLGRVVIAEAAVHLFTALSLQKPDLHSQNAIAGLIVSISSFTGGKQLALTMIGVDCLTPSIMFGIPSTTPV